MSNKEYGFQIEPNLKSTERESIHNLWDQDSRILFAKKKLQSCSLNTLDELDRTGHTLLSSADPYEVKLGIQILRMCLNRDLNLARSWVYNDAPKMMQHEHPRVRHSSLWNVRTAVWIDESISSQALFFANQGLIDQDSAVQRVAIWTHGDSVINNPQQFPKALSAINQFLTLNKKESTALFALEEFFVPLRRIFIHTEEYQDSVKTIIKMFPDYIGLKERASRLIGIKNVIDQDNRNSAQQRLVGMTNSIHIGEMVKIGEYLNATNSLLQEMKNHNSFAINMRNTWLIREMLWLESTVAQTVFSSLKNVALQKSDGDLMRTICVVLGDCLLLSPLLAEEATEFVRDFYNLTDNDGSQIVATQTLISLTKQSQEINRLLKSTIDALSPKASNRSVSFTLQLLREDTNE